MQIEDEAIILKKNKFQERGLIITVFTKNHGLYSGVMSNSKKAQNQLIEGNLIDFHWNARLESHIGNIKCELVKAYSSDILLNKTKLYSFNAIVQLVVNIFYERSNHNEFYRKLKFYLQILQYTDNPKVIFIYHILMELEILKSQGNNLQLTRCAVTKQANDLYYVSPKSGMTISKEIGKEYHSKLLRMPEFLNDVMKSHDIFDFNQEINDYSDIFNEAQDIIINQNQVKLASRLTEYFLNKYLIEKQKNIDLKHKFTYHIHELIS